MALERLDLKAGLAVVNLYSGVQVKSRRNRGPVKLVFKAIGLEV